MHRNPKTLLAGGLLLGLALSRTGLAGADTPRVDHRRNNQQTRIEQGLDSGALTRREANRLEHQQSRIEHLETAVKADGTVNNAERARLTHQQNKASRNIARKNNNTRQP
ncbi:hypothetical protein NP590_02135 [Methylomonas sp. SURF-2]|uniref:Uncharacterized protein n=1 Tax=Methylomonas subterranea TaxID=2952225 RepID=A0ABT1TBS3_9GAMM|nr:hypothetical protein [Methylomonas sp. SURF-2]MCQ8102891.1 hypothetical protein [Methylomonas sp. SURF-2]